MPALGGHDIAHFCEKLQCFCSLAQNSLIAAPCAGEYNSAPAAVPPAGGAGGAPARTAVRRVDPLLDNPSFAEQENAWLRLFKAGAVHMRQTTLLFVLRAALYKRARSREAGSRSRLLMRNHAQQQRAEQLEQCTTLQPLSPDAAAAALVAAKAACTAAAAAAGRGLRPGRTGAAAGRGRGRGRGPAGRHGGGRGRAEAGR
jgi:hypothetical protein